MWRRWFLILLVTLAVPAWAQLSDEADADTAGKESDAAAAESADETESDAEEDGAEEDPGDEDPDELYSEEDEDKFIPSEDVAFGQSIVFPTDI